MTLAHELGHNIGLVHSGVDLADTGTSEEEYGDASCVMGHGELDFVLHTLYCMIRAHIVMVGAR